MSNASRAAVIVFDDRSSDSPYVERIWRSHSERAGVFHSMAATHCNLVVTRAAGKTYLTVRGPETRSTAAHCPAQGEWIGIRFKLGAFMPAFPANALRDRRDVTLPDVSGTAFLLDGSAWEYPTFENAEALVKRLVNAGLVTFDRSVDAALRPGDRRTSKRTEQRHVLRATGMTLATIRQIERARRAANLLRQGVGILDVVYDTGYFDQPHLTRSMKRLIGQTPAQVARGEEQLSLLYNTMDA